MKNQFLLTSFLLLFVVNSSFSQVVSSSSNNQPTTVKPGELAGSSFNGDVNLFTGTYGASYTVGSVATPGGLKFDVNMVYSSSLSAGDNVPVAAGIPYGEGWSVQVPTISVSVAEFKSYSDEVLRHDADILAETAPRDLDVTKIFSEADGNSFYFSPMVNIPGVASGRAVFKYLQKDSNFPVFVLRSFEDQYIEIIYKGNEWEIILPDGTRYEFFGSLTYSKGYNRRKYDYDFNQEVVNVLTGFTPGQVISAQRNVLPQVERLMWRCTRIANRNMFHQFIDFHYKGYGQFNFFKEFSSEYMYYLNAAFSYNINPTPSQSLDVFTESFLVDVTSSTGDRVELEYRSDNDYGPDMLKPGADGVQRLDSMYNYKTVYTADFTSWNRYMHAKHSDFASHSIMPSSTNPFIAYGASQYDIGTYIRKNSGATNPNVVSFNHSFLESPRLGNSSSNGSLHLIGGDIYEIKSKITGTPSNLNRGFANIDINIATGKPSPYGELIEHKSLGTTTTYEVLDANNKDKYYTNEPIFTTFGNGVKWNPAGKNGVISTSNYFTMPNIPQDYEGVTIQIGPGNSDNFFDLNPIEITGVDISNQNKVSAIRSYWHENRYHSSHAMQNYEQVPSNFGIGLPWQMMKPTYYRMLSYGAPDVNANVFKFWWYDDVTPNGTPYPSFSVAHPDATYPNVPTLLDVNSFLSDVELVRYSKNPYMLQSVKTYKVNGEIKGSHHVNPGKILVNQFDFEYKREESDFLDNAAPQPGTYPSYVPNRKTNTYLLKNIKNVPVNGSKDVNNTLPVNTDAFPSTHFEYYAYAPGIPVPYIVNQGRLRTNTTLFALKKITNHLGKETEITYLPFDYNNDQVIVTEKYYSGTPTQYLMVIPPPPSLQDRNFAVQINLVVQSISITDNSTFGNIKRWDYNFEVPVLKEERNLNTPPSPNQPFIFSRSRDKQIGWKTATVTEPEINGQRPYSIYHHSGDNFLFGKLTKVESFNGAGVKLKDKEIFYAIEKAFTNGFKTRDWTGDYNYDYERFENPLIYHPDIPSGMTGTQFMSNPSTFLETAISGFADDSYFIKKVKEIDREFETTTCNIPDFNINDGTETGKITQLPASNPPVDPVTNIPSKVGDESLINLINTNKLGKNLAADLIAASPLSDNVLMALLDKIPYYKPKTYSDVLEVQPVLSDVVIAKLLYFPVNIRDNIIRNATLSQQYQLSADVLRSLIAAQPPLDPALIQNALIQYNALPEDILLSIINRNPKYTTEFISSVLLKQVYLSEQVHQLLLGKTYLPDNLIKKVFVSGASYPTDNTLVTMINRHPNIEPDVIKEVLIESPYQHTEVVMNALISKFGNHPIVGIVQEHNTSLPSWSAYCNNDHSYTTLSMEQVTEYEYWDANEVGETTSEGFKKLLDVTDATVHLMYEPSWQLYRTKTYSPQLPGAFTEKEYFYYYDLKNKYNRRDNYAPTNSVYQNYGEEIISNPGSNPYITYLTSGEIGEPIGLKLSHELNLRNIAYQERTTSKNVADESPIARSTFYHYDNEWNDLIELFPVQIYYYDENDCYYEPVPVNPDPINPPQPIGGCILASHTINEYTLGGLLPPLGKKIYSTQTGLYECPCNENVSNFNVIELVASNCGYSTERIGESDPYNPGGDDTQAMPITDILKGLLLLKEVHTQIDTLVNEDYFSSLDKLPFPSSTRLMEFKSIDGLFNNYGESIFEPVYPFDVLKVKEIKERNVYTQVELEANEKGLLTKYWYTKYQSVSYTNTACEYTNSLGNTVFENFSGYRHYNIGVPIAITVGYTLPDSLRTEYEYYPDYSVKQITDPNGIKLSYKYDEYGRLKESYRNNKLLSVNKYSTWNNDVNLSFLDRTLSNYVETYQLKDNGSEAALQSRKYIDPLGRDFHTISTENRDYNGDPLIHSVPTEVVHTGAITYDNWNRAIETYKPFVDGDGITPVTFGYVPNSLTNSTTNASLYPNISSFAAYENDQRSRVLREAKPGEALNTAHNVKYRYSMANYVCGGCELELNANEANLIMGPNPTNVRFKVVEVEDEDGKVSKEYFNALGQKVATKQFIGLEEAITLFIYDSYGNLTKVINPEKQESNYHYNMLGWLYQKETVDGGITKYMFNESGQVVLEQDENARTNRSCDATPTDQPYYREYDYDIFGRLTGQSKKYYQSTTLDMSANIHLPMLYTNSSFNVTVGAGPTGHELFHDGQFYTGTPNAYLYKFTNNSTYAWKAKTYFIQPSYSSTLWFPISNFAMVYNLAPKYEKQLNYGENISISPNYHATTVSILTNGRTNMKGNLSHVAIYGNSTCDNVPELVKYDFYSYNSDGNLAWQMQQFNANGINPINKGLVARIDYPKYDLNNNLLVENIDVNNDLVLDMQYNYTYDYRNRIREVRVSLADEKENGQLLAGYEYNNATGLVTKTNYHKNCLANESNEIDQISYSYDVRDRLTSMNSIKFLDYNLYYDNNMPTTNLGVLSTISNFNGNINGTKANYRFSEMQGYVGGSNFDSPTSYAYQYDGINRLTDANAYWNENGLANTLLHQAAKYGDVAYAFDKIGNLTNLKRHIDAFGNTQEWNYNYQPGSNKLTQVLAQNLTTTNRNYTYDDAGNVLTDDFRGVNQSIYGRANLPFNLQITKGSDVMATQYLYDASDARIFKGLYGFAVGDELGTTFGGVINAEFYLRDAAGNTIGILDLNTGEWTWYTFGRERFAKIKPSLDQQPQFFAIDNQRKDTTFIDSTTRRQQFISEVNKVLNADPDIQTQLLKVDLIDGTSFWISENNLTTFTDTVADSTYVITQEMNLNNQNQLINMDNKLVSIGVLTGKNTATADASIVFRDSSIIINNKDTTGNIDTNSTLRSKGDPIFAYTFHPNTNVNDISYYLYDHLGNTRVVFKPELTDGSVVLAEDFNKASRFANEVGDEFIGSSPCVGCPNWKGYNNLITNVSYDNGRIRCEENPIYTNIYYGLTMPFPTENLKTYHVSFDYDSDGSQLTCGASIRVEISNGTVANGTQIVGFSTSNSHIEFTFQAQGTVHRLNMIARNTDPAVFPKHFYIDNVEIKEVGTSASCDVAYTLEYAADYYPYGKILREFQNGLGAEKYLTTHHERDTETGLDYRGARYYDADIGRFGSNDPDAHWYPSYSPYNYVAGNPLLLVDHSGKGPEDFRAGFFAALLDNASGNLGNFRGFRANSGGYTADDADPANVADFNKGLVAGDAFSIVLGGLMIDGGLTLQGVATGMAGAGLTAEIVSGGAATPAVVVDEVAALITLITSVLSTTEGTVLLTSATASAGKGSGQIKVKDNKTNSTDGNNKPTKTERMQSKKTQHNQSKKESSSESKYTSKNEHRKKTKSKRNKHEAGQKTDKMNQGGEKGDIKRTRYK